MMVAMHGDRQIENCLWDDGIHGYLRKVDEKNARLSGQGGVMQD